MGVDRQSLAAAPRTSEGKLSLDSDQAQPSVNDGEAVSHRVLWPAEATAGPRGAVRAARAGSRRALAVTMLIPAAVIALAACGNSAPLPATYLSSANVAKSPDLAASDSEALAAKISS